jgi:hypothetical protein
MIDPMLPTATLNECFKAYIRKDDMTNALQNPFLSPAGASDEILRKFPDKSKRPFHTVMCH